MSRWSLWIFRSHVQKSRSKHSSQPNVSSAQYLLTPSLDQYKTWCRCCPQWVNDPFWFSGHMFKGQGQTTLLSPLCCLLNIFWPLHLIYQTWCRGCPQWLDDPYYSLYVQRSRSNHSSLEKVLLVSAYINKKIIWCVFLVLYKQITQHFVVKYIIICLHMYTRYYVVHANMSCVRHFKSWQRDNISCTRLIKSP